MFEKHRTKDKIVKLLLSCKKEEFTIRAIAKKISIDYKTVYLVIHGLIDEHVIFAKKVGQTILCSINHKQFNADIFRTEIIRREELLKNKNFSVLLSYFQEIKEPFFILLLFGSHASGKPRKGSDIDLMLITDDEKVKQIIKHKILLIPLHIHLLEFSSEEFISMLKTTDFNVGKEVFYNNILLFGIEDYYRMIQHA